MNIQSIPFKGNYKNYYNSFSRKNTSRNNDTRYKEKFNHSEVLRPRDPNKNNINKKGLIAIPLTTATLGTTMALLLTFCVPLNSTSQQPKTVPFNTNETSIVSIAEENDCNLDFLLDYNNIDGNTDLNSVTEIIVPSSYNYLQSKIEEIKETLSSKNPNNKKREELEEMLAALRKKQYEQAQVAQMYTDGEYIFLTINIKENNEDERYKYGINVETLKKLFDIKDGAIRENNDLDVRWEAYENGEGSYMDYTYNWFHNGDIIKVPVSAIQTKNINLSQYLEE